MKRVLAMIGAMLLLSGLSGAALAETRTITLGAALQLTGALANTGRYYRDAYQLVVDRINERGGVSLGGEPYRLALDILDNQSDVNLGVRQYVQLVTRDKVNFLLGPYSSNDALDDSSVAEKYEVPMVQGGGASDQIFSRGYKYIFGTLPPAGDYFGSTIEMLGKLEPKPRKAALIAADDAFDVSMAKGTRKLLEKAGIEIVVDQLYAARSSDFSSILSLIKAREPEIVLWGGLEPEVLNAIRQMKSLDVSPKLLYSFTVGVPTADLRKALGRDADYAFGMTSWLPSPKFKDDWFGDAEQFARLYREKYGYDPDYHAAAAAAAVETFVKAIEAARSLDPKAVRDAIAKLDFRSLFARIGFDERGQIVLPQTVIQIQDGAVVEIYGDTFVNPPRYPIPPWDKRG